MLARLGDGGYEVGSRARQIRDRLQARDTFAPADLLAIQLDARAGFLSRWRDLMLRVLTPRAVAGHDGRRALREALTTTWTGAADPQSAGYRLVRAFREQVMTDTIAFVLADCYEADPAFDYTTVRRREGPIWALVTLQPMHLLDPAFASWDALLLASMDTVVQQTLASGVGTLAAATWEGYNATAYRHPLSPALSFASRWLDMPARPLPGDLFTPRMRWGTLTSSERMIVSPGRERDGIMHMPTGQSGHPLSPFYANSHAAWADGTPTPFLPGPAVHTLTLVP
jgi:penicillin amidase